MNSEFAEQVTISENNTLRHYSIYLNWLKNWLAGYQVHGNKQ